MATDARLTWVWVKFHQATDVFGRDGYTHLPFFSYRQTRTDMNVLVQV
jgi:hypothetical protein